jgi:hypothetical protein
VNRMADTRGKAAQQARVILGIDIDLRQGIR